ncbi:hypothetical protein EVAR_96778_1 [Eumeta japonica]|uniref:Uncharacterized protein n=1 Tax=Eumeta variegata TaxID=151549 RepID=A0A4C1WRG9_EUMVA|nr:hypothetical protein EVAR_96778_1 [Eumeta japonica]
MLQDDLVQAQAFVMIAAARPRPAPLRYAPGRASTGTGGELVQAQAFVMIAAARPHPNPLRYAPGRASTGAGVCHDRCRKAPPCPTPLCSRPS